MMDISPRILLHVIGESELALPGVLGLGWCATLGLRLKDSALLSWSKKSEDSWSFTLPPVAGLEEDATKRKRAFFSLSRAIFNICRLEQHVYLLVSWASVQQRLAWPRSLWESLVWPEPVSLQSCSGAKTMHSGSLPAAAPGDASFPACAWAPLRSRTFQTPSCISTQQVKMMWSKFAMH